MASAACVNNNNNNNNRRSLAWIGAASDMDFEFCCLNEGVDGNGMLPADQLFSNGKLLPLLHRVEEPPKAPSTSGGARWKHLLPFKKKRPCHSSSSSSCSSSISSSSSGRSSSSLPSLALPPNNSNTSAAPNKMTTANKYKSLNHFLPSRCCPTSSDSSLNVPLLQKGSLSISSSSSSSSSSSRHDDLDNVEHVLPRLSLDSSSIAMRSRPNMNMNMKANPVGVGLVESPRMKSWGKIVFHTSLSSLSLERSSSSPSSFFNNHVNNNNNNPYTVRRSYSSTTSTTTSSSRPSSLPSLFPFRPLFSSRTTPTTTAPTITRPHHHHQHPHPHRHTHKLNP